MLHAISHDLRSPLTAITTAVSALRSDRVSAAEHGELVDVIDGESVRLAKLVDDLLDLSKIQAGAVAPRPDWCDLSDVVASAVAHLPDTQAIELELPLDLPLVQADAAQLERVFSNLLENAVKFSPAGSPVRVTGGAAAGRVTVRVTDRGRGDSRPAARPGVRAVLPRPDRSQPGGGRRRDPASDWRSSRASSRPTVGASSCSPGPTWAPRSPSASRWRASRRAAGLMSSHLAARESSSSMMNRRSCAG